MKLCVDCKFAVKRDCGAFQYHECDRKRPADAEIKTISLVTGMPKVTEKYYDKPCCTTDRISDWLCARLFDQCGKEGRFFQAKEQA